MSEVDKYEVLEKIGHGSFGVIRKVKRKSDGHVLCRKEISYSKMSQKEREQLQAELSILKGLRHPNIVAYYEREHIKASSDLHIYMEYCEQGDLGKCIKDLKRSNKMADEDFVWSVFSQLVTALYRCHYGEDAPEVGRNVIGLSSDAKPLKSKMSHEMILHRDLKPENIFLGADASVKLGDFGLSKIMHSHDFASTYVGTPFYMSPEICAAEQYSLHSDIWAFGCIMYELCAKEPPFNAKTHMELIQKIRLGRITPLSHLYSTELKDSISKCLRVNPSTRPDTVQLLNIPMVKLKRKELEIVRLGRQLRMKEDIAARTLLDAERRLARLDADKHAARAELDSQIRREWEVKARLEIDRQVQQTRDHLRKEFDAEVTRRVAEMVGSRPIDSAASNTTEPPRSSTPDASDLPQDKGGCGYHQSQSTTGEPDDFPSSTDLSELSLESPSVSKPKAARKTARTPFGRAQTMFDGSPADIAMADPSPAPIASLNLSPRRDKANPAPQSRNIFAAAAASSSSIESDTEGQSEDDDDDDEIPALASPTRPKHSGDPFKALGNARRPGMLRQKTAPLKHASQSHLVGGGTRFPTRENSQANLAAATLNGRGGNPSTSPTRHVSKLPSATNNQRSTSPHRRLPDGPTSPQRRPPSRKHNNEPGDLRHTAAVNSHVQGRTLVELAQARASAGSNVAVHDFGNEMINGDVATKKGATLQKEDVKPRGDVTVWDPERDEMPSPFLAKAGRGMLPGTLSAPGMKHLR